MEADQVLGAGWSRRCAASCLSKAKKTLNTASSQVIAPSARHVHVHDRGSPSVQYMGRNSLICIFPVILGRVVARPALSIIDICRMITFFLVYPRCTQARAPESMSAHAANMFVIILTHGMEKYTCKNALLLNRHQQRRMPNPHVQGISSSRICVHTRYADNVQPEPERTPPSMQPHLGAVANIAHRPKIKTPPFPRSMYKKERKKKKVEAFSPAEPKRIPIILILILIVVVVVVDPISHTI